MCVFNVLLSTPLSSMASVDFVAPDWASLPFDVVDYISKSKSLTVFDLHAFRRVCRSWAYALRSLRPPPRAPYLLLDGDNGEHFTFLDLASNSFFRRVIPGLRGKYCIGSQYGWLATLDAYSEVALLNPVTGEEIRLPSIVTYPDIKVAEYAPDGSVAAYYERPLPSHPFQKFTPKEMLLMTFLKVVLSANPSTAPGGKFTVAALFGIPQRLVFTRSGEDRWHVYREMRFHDLVFHDGLLLGINSFGQLHSMRLDGAAVERKVLTTEKQSLAFGGKNKYLAVDEAGRLMYAWRTSHLVDRAITPTRTQEVRETTRIELQWLDKERMRWVPVRKLDSHALFIGTGTSMLLSAPEVCGVKANHVYFTDDWWDFNYGKTARKRPRDVGVYSLETHSARPCHATDNRFRWPPPIWFTPELPHIDVAVTPP